MTNARKQRNAKLNNKGAALVTVIIAVAFVSILATVILYLAVMNFQMKSNDYKTRVSFYGAETPLEELRVQLAVDMSVASEEAYKQVMMQFGDLNDENLRVSEYQAVITDEIVEIWNERTKDVLAGKDKWCYGIGKVLHEVSSGTNDLVDPPHKYHVITGTDTTVTCSDATCPCAYHVIVLDTGGAPRIEAMLSDVTGDGNPDYYIAFRGIKVSYTENSFSSVISTDYCMMVPEYNWSMDSYDPTWDDSISTIDREQVSYESGVVYLNYRKQ